MWRQRNLSVASGNFTPLIAFYISLKESLLLLQAMSAYDNVVGGKLKLKGKALDVKVGGVKKKKKVKKQHEQISRDMENEHPAGLLFNYYLNCLAWT